MNPVYLEILKDSFLAHFVFTISGELAYPLVLSFGKANIYISSLYGLVGSVAGLSATYCIFFGMALALKKLLETNPGYPPAQHYVSKFSPLICCFELFPMMSVIPPFFCGIAKVKYWKFLLFTVIYRCFYYVYMIETLKIH